MAEVKMNSEFLSLSITKENQYLAVSLLYPMSENDNLFLHHHTRKQDFSCKIEISSARR